MSRLLWLPLVMAALAAAAVLGQGWTASEAILETRLAVKVEVLQRLIAVSPRMWRFQELRIREALETLPVPLAGEQAEVLTIAGDVLARTIGDAPTPTLTRTATLHDAGAPVGQLTMQISLRPAVLESLSAGLLGLLGGLATALALLRARRRVERLQAEVEEQQEHARITLSSISDAVVSTDVEGRIESLNPAAERLVRMGVSEARGRRLDEVLKLIDERTLEPIADPVRAALDGHRSKERDGDEVSLARDDGSSVAVELTTSRLHDAAGQVVGVTVVLRDVSALRRMAQRISWAATHDSLTGLVNRREFEARVDAALVRARNSDEQHVVCYIDLDQFKLVNDSSGHAAGDGLLRALATVVQQHLRAGDTFARLGGDEFGVLLEDCPMDRARDIAEHLLGVVRDFRFNWNGRIFSVGASIGLAEVTGSCLGTAEIFSAADAACYWAKEQGRNRVCTHRSSDADLAERRREMGWAARLTAALDQGRFTLHYQPYQALNPGHMAGRHIEILLRLSDEEGELVPPGTFLPAAERFNLMPQIDRWVIEQVLSRYHALNEKLGPGLVCAVNLSGTTVNSEGLLEHIRSLATRHRIPAGAICFEITETAAVNNLRDTNELMRELQGLGFRFALDDFGIGTSSFAYLKSLPVDYLKIDGSFVRNIAHDAVDRAMVETINRIGQLMGLSTVGEYAESEAVIAELRLLGVDYAQGFGVQRPAALPLTEPSDTATLEKTVA